MYQVKVNKINADEKMVVLLEINYVIDVVTYIVNFIKARALNHRQVIVIVTVRGARG